MDDFDLKKFGEKNSGHKEPERDEEKKIQNLQESVDPRRGDTESRVHSNQEARTGDGMEDRKDGAIQYEENKVSSQSLPLPEQYPSDHQFPKLSSDGSKETNADPNREPGLTQEEDSKISTHEKEKFSHNSRQMGLGKVHPSNQQNEVIEFADKFYYNRHSRYIFVASSIEGVDPKKSRIEIKHSEKKKYEKMQEIEWISDQLLPIFKTKIFVHNVETEPKIVKLRLVDPGIFNTDYYDTNKNPEYSENNHCQFKYPAEFSYKNGKQRIKNDHIEQFGSYALLLLSEPTLAQNIPLLISDFQERSTGKIPFKPSIIPFIDAVSNLMNKHQELLDDHYARQILNIIGLFPADMRIFEALPDEYFHILRESQFKYPSEDWIFDIQIQGLLHILMSRKVKEEEKWLHFIIGLEELKTNILISMLERINCYELKLTNSELNFMKDVLEYTDEGERKQIIHRCCYLLHFYEFHDFIESVQQYIENQDILEILNCQTPQAKYNLITIEINLKCLKRATENMKELVHQSKMFRQMVLYLNNFEVTPSSVESLKSIFVENADEVLISQIETRSICVKIIKESNYSISYIFEILRPHKADKIELFKIWMIRKFNRCIKNQISITLRNIDQEMRKIEDSEDYSSEFVALLVKYCDTNSLDLLSLLPIMNETSNNTRNEFTKYVCKNMSKISSNPLEKMLKINIPNPGLEINTSILISLIPSAKEIDLIFVANKLIDSSSEIDLWGLILRQHDSLKTIEYVEKLTDLVYEFSQDILNRNIKIDKIRKIKAFSLDQRQKLMNLLNLSATCKNMEALSEESLDRVVQEVDQLDNDKKKLLEFLYKVCTKIKSKEPFIENISDFFHIFENSKLSELVYPLHILSLINCAKELNHVVDSSIYKKIYIPEQSTELSQTNTILVTTNAMTAMTKELTECFLLSKFSKMPRLIHIFSEIDDLNTEIEILRNVMSIESIPNIERIAEFIDQRSLYLEYCDFLPKLMNCLGFSDESLIATCDIYIDTCSIRIDLISVNQFLEISILAENKLRNDLTREQLEMIIEFSKKFIEGGELVEFVKQIREDELEVMREVASNYEENCFINAYVLYDLEHTKDFVKSFKILSYIELRTYFQEIDKEYYEQILKNFSSCNSQLIALKDLYSELKCKEESKKKQIMEIYTDSYYNIFEKKNKKSFDIHLKYKSNENYEFNLETLLELRSRASLIVHTSHDEEEETQTFKIFIEFINTLQNFVLNLNELQALGHPEDQPTDQRLLCLEGNFNETKSLNDHYSTILLQFERTLAESYQKHCSLTLLFGNQFWTLEKYLWEKQNEKEAFNLFHYMGKSAQGLPELKRDSDDIQDRLMNLGEYLDCLPTKEPRAYDFIKEYQLEQKLIQKDRQIFYIINQDFTRALFSLWIALDIPFPEMNQLFFCKLDVNRTEIDAFLNRCFKYPDVLFIVVNCERLSIENQSYFKTLFHKLCFESYPGQNFKLAIISADFNSSLMRYFRYTDKLEVTKILDSRIIGEDVCSEIVRQINNKTTLVTSRISGLGKTTWIHEESEKPVINFPVSGNIDIKTIGARLSTLNLSSSSNLNIQIAQIDRPDLLNDILISLTLFKMLYYVEDIFIVPDDMHIYIEIANSYNESLLKSLDFIKYIRSEHLDSFSIERLIADERIDYVCAYLSLFRSGRINTKEIDESDIESLTSEEKKDLIREYFCARYENSTYSQLEIFIKVLTFLLKNFSKCPFFGINIREQMIDHSMPRIEFDNLRSLVIEGLLLTTEEFITKSTRSTKERQDEALGTPIEYIETNFESYITWESTNHFNLIFLPDGTTRPIYRDQNQVPEKIRKLIYIQTNYANSSYRVTRNTYKILDYSKLSHPELLEILLRYSKTGELTHNNFNYVITPDNFLKMNLVYLRACSGVPVVLVGETGCGKTSLIRFLVENVLGEHLSIISIHAGITRKILLKLMKKLIETALELQSSYNQLWVFFDEFNTSECIATICEMLIHRSFEGEALPQNMIFVAACNPYRHFKKVEFIESAGIKNIKKDVVEFQQLAHKVQPLPNSIIDFVWDFGALTDKDIFKYVKSMLTHLDESIKELFINLICVSQNYFRNEEDKSSVSLRDVSRFLILYEWFIQSIQSKQGLRNSYYMANMNKYNKDVSVDHENVILDSGILALCHCYYLRLSSQEKRLEYLNIVSTVSHGALNIDQIQKIIENEQLDFLMRMKLPEGTAFNLALRENLFGMIPCILNKIPVFLCGKPGCSKSLAVQLIFSNFNGRNSQDEYFRTLPALRQFYFQGSESSTSEGIKKVFNRAKAGLENTQGRIHVVVIDEIGLAENSKHNPLKVLHNLLELEYREVAFIGVSNWRLDASKMNRALYLSRPEPGEEDLVQTAKHIYDSYSKGNDMHYPVIESLALAYNRLKLEYRKPDYFKFAEFYGLRDFYSLIKEVSSQLVRNKIQNFEKVSEIAKKAIQRNFGVRDGVHLMNQYFKKLHHFEGIFDDNVEKYSIEQLILDNLEDKNARYLMLIGKGDVVSYLLNKILKDRDRRMFVGSKLEHDENEEDYGFKSLSEIILYLEKGLPIILRDMDHIYSSLYDLLNQNFIVTEGRRYCRIALGAHSNNLCFVHDNFRAIVLLDDDEQVISEIDPPLLNRFQKHKISLGQMLNKENKEALENLKNWVNSLICEKKSCIKIVNIFPFYNEQSCALLVLNFPENTFYNCKRELLKVAPPDILILAETVGIEPEEQAFIKSTWRNLHQMSFSRTLEQMLEGNTSHNKLLAITYDEQIPGNIFGNKLNPLIWFRHFSNFKSEQDLQKDISAFYRNTEMKILLLELDLSVDGKHLTLIDFLINSIEKQTRNDGKIICLVVHMMRNIEYKNSLLLMESWEMRMFESLNDKSSTKPIQKSLSASSFDLKDEYLNKPRKKPIKKSLSAPSLDLKDESLNKPIKKSTLPSFLQTDEFLKKSTKELIIENKFLPFSTVIAILTETSLLNFDFRSKSKVSNFMKKHLILIIENISRDPELAERFLEKLIPKIEDTEKIDDWRTTIFSDANIVMQSRNLLEAIQNALITEISKSYNTIIFLLERHIAFTSLFAELDEVNTQIIRQIWFDCFSKLPISGIKLLDTSQNARIELDYELNFPFITLEYRTIRKVYSNCLKNYDEFAPSCFKEMYNESTGYSNFISEINSNETIKSIFFKDFIKISLNENFMQDVHEEIVFNLHKSAIEQTTSFEDELLSFLENEKVLLLFCKILEVYSDIKNEHANLDLPYRNDGNIKSKISDHLDNLIPKILPSREFCEQHFNSYFSKLEKMDNLVFELINNDIEFRTLPIFEFWTAFFHLFLKTQADKSVLYRMIENTHENFMKDANYKNYLFNELRLLQGCSDDTADEFKALYYSLSLDVSPDCIGAIAEDLESTQLWKHSCKIIFSILDNSKLFDAIPEIIDDPTEFSMPENPYIEQLEIALDRGNLTSKFCVLVSDMMIKHAIQPENECTEEVFQMNYNVYQSFLEKLSIHDEHFPNLKKLICLSFIKDYLSNFSELYFYEKEMSEEFPNTVFEVLETLGNYPNFQLYFIKCTFKLHNTDEIAFETFLDNHNHISWLKEYSETETKSDLVYIPYVDGLKEEYARSAHVCDLICRKYSNINEINEINNFIENVSTKNSRLSFGIAFMNKIFKLFRTSEQMNTNALSWFESNQEKIKSHLGKEFFSLIQCFVRNFPANSFMHLSCTTDEEHFHKILSICEIFVILVAYNQEQNPITDVFMDANGEIPENLAERFNSKFVFGVESNPLIDHLKMIESNIDKILLENNLAYKCGAECDYIYFVNRCGKPMEQSTCPFCRNPIGGTHHIKVDREGHDIIPKEEILTLVQTSIEKHMNRSERGRSLYNFSIIDTNPRDLSEISYKFLRICLNSSLYMTLLLNLTCDQELEQMFAVPNSNYQTFFEDSLNYDFKRISTLLENKEWHLWIYHIISKLPKLQDVSLMSASTYEERKHFEEICEMMIINNCENPRILINNYKEMIKRELGKELTRIDIIKELRLTDDYYRIELFRMTDYPSIEKMQNTFDKYHRKQEFLIIDVYFKYQVAIKRLAHFYTIIEFTNALLEMFNHKISREEARNTLMSQVLNESEDINKNGDLKHLFNKFLKAWKTVGDTSIYFECTELPKIEFSDESELIYFLPDNRERGGGMYMTAILRELANEQNNLLFEFNKALSASRKMNDSLFTDKISYLIQKVQKTNIIRDYLKDRIIIDYSSVNNPDYGYGEEIHFSFNRIQKMLIKKLSDKKFLDSDKVNLVQYQFELLSVQGEESDLINKIRNSIDQEKIAGPQLREIKEFFRNKKTIQKDKYPVTLKELYSSLSFILTYLKHMKKSGDLSIRDFAVELKSDRICELLKTENSVSCANLKHIVFLYEMIEKKYFPFMKKYIRPEFKQKDPRKEIENNIQGFINVCESNERFPNRKEIKHAVMRLIMRCLVSELNPDRPMNYYIFRGDFWDKDRENVLEEIIVYFPEAILLSHAYVVYKFISKKFKNRMVETMQGRPHTKQQRQKLKPGKKKKINKIMKHN